MMEMIVSPKLTTTRDGKDNKLTM